MMNKTAEMTAIDTMQARTSVRKYEQGFQMPQQDVEEILKAAASAPSSWNLQHWKFLVIQNEENKQKLLPIAYQQQQIVDSSVTIAILGDLEANQNGEAVYGGAVEQGYMNEEVKNTLLKQIDGAYENSQFARDEAYLNAGFAAMQLMLAAKQKGYDTCPIGGFNRVQFQEEFKVPKRYVPVMLLTLGKAAGEAHATERFSLENLVINEEF